MPTLTIFGLHLTYADLEPGDYIMTRERTARGTWHAAVEFVLGTAFHSPAYPLAVYTVDCTCFVRCWNALNVLDLRKYEGSGQPVPVGRVTSDHLTAKALRKAWGWQIPDLSRVGCNPADLESLLNDPFPWWTCEAETLPDTALDAGADWAVQADSDD